VVVLGTAALVGWALQSRSLTDLGTASSLKANTALCLVALGIAVLLMGTERQRLRTVLEVAAAVVATATILEHARARSLGIDELLFDDRFSPIGAAGRASEARISCSFSRHPCPTSKYRQATKPCLPMTV